MTTWRNRIIGSGEKPASDFLAHPDNWRIHPKPQQDALSGVLAEVGWVQQVVENVRTGRLIDGHLRIGLALSQGDETPVPYVQVDISEEEERLVLATLDPLSAMAGTDAGKLDELLREISTGEAGLQAMLAELAESAGVVPPDWDGAMASLPEGDKAPFQQMTFTVSDAQAERVKAALDAAKGAGSFNGTGNENSNGNALARICEAYLG